MAELVDQRTGENICEKILRPFPKCHLQLHSARFVPISPKEVERVVEDSRASLHAVVQPARTIPTIFQIERGRLTTCIRGYIKQSDMEFIGVLGEGGRAGLTLSYCWESRADQVHLPCQQPPPR